MGYLKPYEKIQDTALLNAKALDYSFSSPSLQITLFTS